MQTAPINPSHIRNALTLSYATDDELYRQIGSRLTSRHPPTRHFRIYFKTIHPDSFLLHKHTSSKTKAVDKRDRDPLYERKLIILGEEFFRSVSISPALRRKLCRGAKPTQRFAKITDGGNEREIVTAILAILAGALPFFGGEAAVSALVPLAAMILKKGLHEFCYLTYQKKKRKKKKKKNPHDDVKSVQDFIKD